MFSKHAAEGAIILERLPKSAASGSPNFDLDIDITMVPGRSCTIKIEIGGSSGGRDVIVEQQQIAKSPRGEGDPTIIPADESRDPTPPEQRKQQPTIRNPTAGSQSLLDPRENAGDKQERGDQETCKRQENTDKESAKRRDEPNEDNKEVIDSGEKPLKNKGETNEGEIDDHVTVSGTEDIDGQKVNSKRVGDDMMVGVDKVSQKALSRAEIIDLTKVKINVDNLRHFYTIKVFIPYQAEPVLQTIVPLDGLPEELQKHKAPLPVVALISEVLATPESTAAGVHSQNKRDLNKKKSCASGEVSA